MSERDGGASFNALGGGGRELFMFKMKGIISINRMRKTQQFLYYSIGTAVRSMTVFQYNEHCVYEVS